MVCEFWNYKVKYAWKCIWKYLPNLSIVILLLQFYLRKLGRANKLVVKSSARISMLDCYNNLYLQRKHGALYTKVNISYSSWGICQLPWSLEILVLCKTPLSKFSFDVCKLHLLRYHLKIVLFIHLIYFLVCSQTKL